MAITAINTLKQWFQTGMIPRQEQFWAIFDSFRHKSDKVPASDIEGIDNLLLNKADKEAFITHLSNEAAHSDLFNAKVDKETGKVLSDQNFTVEEKNKLANIYQWIAANVQGAPNLGALTPSTVPSGTGSAYWFTMTAGTYTNAGGVVVQPNSLAVIVRDNLGSFSISQTPLGIDLSTYATKTYVDTNAGKIKPFVAQAYPLDSQVNHLGKDWVANAATVASDVPGTSSKWVERLSGYNSVYNVTTNVPLGAGLYYTSDSARLAVPISSRKSGVVITYETSFQVWVTEKYIGQLVTDNTTYWRNKFLWNNISENIILTANQITFQDDYYLDSTSVLSNFASVAQNTAIAFIEVKNLSKIKIRALKQATYPTITVWELSKYVDNANFIVDSTKTISLLTEDADGYVNFDFNTNITHVGISVLKTYKSYVQVSLSKTNRDIKVLDGVNALKNRVFEKIAAISDANINVYQLDGIATATGIGVQTGKNMAVGVIDCRKINTIYIENVKAFAIHGYLFSKSNDVTKTATTDLAYFVGGAAYPENYPADDSNVTYKSYTIPVPPEATYFYFSYKINAPLLKIYKGIETPLLKNSAVESVNNSDLIKALMIGETISNPLFAGLKMDSIGDSYTAGGNAGGVEHSYCNLLATNTGVNFLNLGVSTTTLANYVGAPVAASTNSMVARRTSIRSDANIITIYGGTNDYTYIKFTPSLLGTISDNTENTFYGALNILTNHAIATGAKVILITPLKIREDATEVLIVNAIIEVAKAKGIGCLDLYNMEFFNVSKKSAYIKNRRLLIDIDDLHPNPYGHKVIFYLLKKKVIEMLRGFNLNQ